MKRTVIVFTILSVIAKIIAFGRELVLSYYYGASETSDIFLLSITLPVTIFGFISTGILSGFIPIYQRVLKEKSKLDAEAFSSRVTNLIIMICFALVIIYYLFSNWILRLLASGFTDNALVQARDFTNISIWAIPMTAIVTVLTGYLQINDRIQLTALVSVPLNVGIIITIILAYQVKNLMILPCGFLVSTILQVVVLLLLSIKAGFRYSIDLGFKDEYIRLFLSGLGMLIISSSISQINILIDRTLATQITEGGLSLFEYGSRINDFMMGLTIIPISTAIFPAMAKDAGNEKVFSHQLEEGINLFSIVMIPLTAFVCAFAEPIVKIIYQRGAFDSFAVQNTASIVMYYGAGLFAFAIRELLSKAFYALGDIKTPMINASAALIINVVLNFILMRIMGLGGLALATSISAYLTIVMLYRSLKRHVRSVSAKKVGTCLLKTVLLTMCCTVIALSIFRLFMAHSSNETIMFMLIAGVFFCSYVLLAVPIGLINIEELKKVARKK